jgi:hypothetical protein
MIFFQNTLIALNQKALLHLIIELSTPLYLSIDLRAPPFYILISLRRVVLRVLLHLRNYYLVNFNFLSIGIDRQSLTFAARAGLDFPDDDGALKTI